MMLVGILIAAVASFGLLGLALGVFSVSAALRDGLRSVAQAFSLLDDGEEEEDLDDLLPLDDVNCDIDMATRRTFVEIAGTLGQLQQLGEQIVREESA